MGLSASLGLGFLSSQISSALPTARRPASGGSRRLVNRSRKQVGQFPELGPFAARGWMEQTKADRILVGQDKELIATL
jgi:hypothetical protein